MVILLLKTVYVECPSCVGNYPIPLILGQKPPIELPCPYCGKIPTVTAKGEEWKIIVAGVVLLIVGIIGTVIYAKTKGFRTVLELVEG